MFIKKKSRLRNLLEDHVFDKKFACLGELQHVNVFFIVVIGFVWIMCFLGRLDRAGIRLGIRNEAVCCKHEWSLDMRHKKFGREAMNIASVGNTRG